MGCFGDYLISIIPHYLLHYFLKLHIQQVDLRLHSFLQLLIVTRYIVADVLLDDMVIDI